MLLYSDITVCVFFFLVFSLKPSIYHMGIYQGARSIPNQETYRWPNLMTHLFEH